MKAKIKDKELFIKNLSRTVLSKVLRFFYKYVSLYLKKLGGCGLQNILQPYIPKNLGVDVKLTLNKSDFSASHDLSIG